MLGWAAAAASILLLVASASPIAAADGSYFPLRAGNWWSYEELDDDGRPLSRETWTVLDATPADRTGEFHLRSFTKRLDMLGHMGRRWEGHEFLRTTDLGLHKRYPASGRDKEFEVTLLREPVAAGTRARRCDPGALAERTGIGIPLLVSPEPGAVAESAGCLPVHD